jgi:hypothetical protein
MPEQGMMLELLLQPGWTTDCYRYEGSLELGPKQVLPLQVNVRGGEKWQAEVQSQGGGIDAKLASVLGSLTRSAVRSCVVRGQRPPRRVRRWRPRPDSE